MKEIQQALRESNLETDVIGFLDFIEAGVKGREYAKFVFSKSVSDALQIISKIGLNFNHSTEDLSFSNINCFTQSYSTSRPLDKALNNSIIEGKKSYATAQQLFLPPLIAEPEKVFAFHMPEAEPNFISMNRVSGFVVSVTDDNIEGGIVLIENADPGFDWIFSRNISGFITAYGGANSHMAIRAGELGLPAVIGVGETLFKKYSMSSQIEIDAENRLVRILK